MIAARESIDEGYKSRDSVNIDIRWKIHAKGNFIGEITLKSLCCLKHILPTKNSIYDDDIFFLLRTRWKSSENLLSLTNMAGCLNLWILYTLFALYSRVLQFARCFCKEIDEKYQLRVRRYFLTFVLHISLFWQAREFNIKKCPVF